MYEMLTSKNKGARIPLRTRDTIKYEISTKEELIMLGTKEEVKVLTVKELSNVLRLGRDKTYALIKSPGFPSICIGKRYIVTEQALNSWLKQYEHKEYLV